MHLPIMPNPMPAPESNHMLVPLLPLFEPNSDHPETHDECFNQEGMIPFPVSRPNPDRREATTISTSARMSKYKSTVNTGMRQPSHAKKQIIYKWEACFC